MRSSPRIDFSRIDLLDFAGLTQRLWIKNHSPKSSSSSLQQPTLFGGSSRTPNGMQVFWRKGFVTNSSLLPKDFRCISTGVMPRIDSFLKSNSEKHARLSNTHMADSHDVSRLFLGRISLNQ